MIRKIVYGVLEILCLMGIIGASIWVMLNKDIIQSMGNYSYLALFVCCFLSNASVFLPAPGLMVILSAASVMNPIIVAIVGALGMTAGECIGYLGGLTGRQLISKNAKTEKVLKIVNKYGIFSVFLFALIPFPVFDVIGVVTGYLKFNFIKFILPCYVGKLLKSLTVALAAEYLMKIVGGML